jgi:bifunctional DNA-binding transcriptional regulator/antitoxin component of YhaV-PrlF toxin-antitoxin module
MLSFHCRAASENSSDRHRQEQYNRSGTPKSVRRRAGIKPGDRLEFKVSGGIINITPKLASADDEYTPMQRRVINAQLADAAIRFVHQEIRKCKASKLKDNEVMKVVFSDRAIGQWVVRFLEKFK